MVVPNRYSRASKSPSPLESPSEASSSGYGDGSSGSSPEQDVDNSPETLYEANISDQINAINSDSHRSPPRFACKPLVMRMTIGYDTHGDITHNSKQKSWDKLGAHVTTKRYAAGYFRVEVGYPQRLKGPKLAFPYNPNVVGVVFKEEPWKERYALKV
ncbi:hypothetical protein F25303_9591 [Fusarium sp. NRRL 25303]|nr:hypothetical protein F25303_9591 [Fusarium sp. NRRL 25303]